MPPTAKPTENPAATRGKCAFIWRTSSRRPAWPPTSAKPMGIVSGNSTRRGNVTHTPSHTVSTNQPAATTVR